MLFSEKTVPDGAWRRQKSTEYGLLRLFIWLADLGFDKKSKNNGPQLSPFLSTVKNGDRT